MASIGKLQTQVEISSPADKFFHTYRAKSHLVPKTNSDHNIHAAEVHDGDFHSTSVLKTWTYCLDGKFQTMKAKIEVDEANKTITAATLEGEVLNAYKSFQTVLQVTPKEEGSLVTWTWEYEKVSEDAPDPTKFLNLAVNLTKDVDAHILTEA